MKNNKSNKVATFDQVLGVCNAQGEVYNPSQESIKVAALNSLLTTARETVKAADVSRTAYENAINARQPLPRRMTKLASRVVDALEASGVSQEVLDDAKAIKRRFYSPAKVLVKSSPQESLPDGSVTVEEKYKRSRSQLDWATRVENFQKLLHRVSVEPRYDPNEADLKVPALEAFIAMVEEANRNVITTFVAMKGAMHEVNRVVSEEMYQTVKAVKAYLRSAFGRDSDVYRQIVQLKYYKR